MENKFISDMIDLNPNALKADGFDDCIIGIVESFDGHVFLYSKAKVIKKLSRDMSVEEAFEYYDYNIIGSYIGHHMPVFMLNEEYGFV